MFTANVFIAVVSATSVTLTFRNAQGVSVSRGYTL